MSASEETADAHPNQVLRQCSKFVSRTLTQHTAGNAVSIEAGVEGDHTGVLRASAICAKHHSVPSSGLCKAHPSA